MSGREPWFADLEHLRWLGEHGGGDEHADANCWRDVKPYFARILAVAEALEAIVSPSDPNTDGYAELDAARQALDALRPRAAHTEQDPT